MKEDDKTIVKWPKEHQCGLPSAAKRHKVEVRYIEIFMHTVGVISQHVILFLQCERALLREWVLEFQEF